MGGKGWCCRIGGWFWGIPPQNSSGSGYGQRVELLPASSCCDSPSTSGRKPEETAIPSLIDGETEAQHQLMNDSRSFQRQAITTTPTLHQPSLLPLPNCFYGSKLHQRCCGWSQIRGWSQTPSAAHFFFSPRLQPVAQDPPDGTVRQRHGDPATRLPVGTSSECGSSGGLGGCARCPSRQRWRSGGAAVAIPATGRSQEPQLGCGVGGFS